MNKSLGSIEFRSIAKGIEVADGMVKKASIEILLLKTICPGKFLLILSGHEDEVKEAIDYGLDAAHGYVVDSFTINAVHNDIIQGFKNKYGKYNRGALGIMETINVCSGIYALDKALKSSNVTLAKLQPAFGIGGKLVYIVSGEVSDVEHGMSIARESLEDKKIVNISVIASPDELMISKLL